MFIAPYDPIADHVSEAHAAEFERIIRAVDSTRRFRLLFAQFNQQYFRDSYIQRLKAYYEHSGILYVARENPVDASQLRARLRELAQSHRMIHVVECDSWQVEQRVAWLRHLNAQRELIAQDCPAVLLFWLTETLLKQLALQAPDLWSWRSGVFDFSVVAQMETLPLRSQPTELMASTEEKHRRQQRLTELQHYLQTASISTELRASLLLEQGDLHQAIGELNEAMACFQASLQLYRQLNDAANIAELLDRTAGILQARGELDEALRIRQQEILPICKRLGNERDTAATLGKIADILQARGELDEALRIQREEVLPACERLGDVRSKAVTMGKIADILQARGELDEALRIRQQEELPVYDRLGDVRSKAVTMGKIADILQARGELDEALRIRQQEQLPVYDRLGDVRSKAVTMGQIADILQARGELDEALRIRQQEELPVFDRLGDVRELLITRAKIAMLFMQFTPPRRAEANQLLCRALRAAKKMRIPEMKQIRQILKRFKMKC